MTIKTKIILACTVTFGILFSCFALLVYQGARSAELSKLDAHLESHAQKLQAEVEEQSHEHQFPEVNDFMSIQTEGLQDVRVRLFNQKGETIIADGAIEDISRATIESTLTQPAQFSTVRVAGEEFRHLLIPLEIDDRNMYVLQLATPIAIIDANTHDLRNLILFGIPICLLLTSAAAYLIINAGFRPITSMIETAGKISAENLAVRLALPDVKDEISLLGNTLNMMIGRIQSAFNSQRQFIADASHEFRTPLTIICSELEYVQQRTDDAKLKEGIRIALAEVDRLAMMTERMLLLSKLDVSRPTLSLDTIRLDEMLAECSQIMKGLCAQKHVNLQVYVEDAVEIRGDGDKLKSALLNLLDNAIKYSKPQGEISLSLFKKKSASGSVFIKVQDSGIGISPADLPHIFKRFYRATSMKGEHSGSGLGLAIVDEIVKLHHGTITVNSEEQKGTVVTIELPLNAEV
jgi:signal transduction histidine kinase